ncbi:MAG: hypothetical protein AB7C91_07285 [Sphaerochaeta sp.]|uniref:hypothetical protein n=1 Tax=Sphaerochaeta sp. TaxID=1972642 RepID=UPI003D0EC672
MLLLTSVFLNAGSLSSLTFGASNDWYTLGLGNNTDDARSFGSDVQVQFSDKLQFSWKTEAFTDRMESLRRYDVQTFSIAYPLVAKQGERLQTDLQMGLGLVVTGDTGLQDVQNLLHSLIGRDKVTLLYEGAEPSLHPSISLSWESGVHLSRFLIGAKFEAQQTFNWETSGQGSLYASYADIIQVYGGYRLLSIAGIYPSQSIQQSRYEGLTFGYSYDGGLLRTSYYTYPLTGYSYGGFSFDVLAFGKPKTFRHSDFSFSTGFLYDLEGQQNRLFSIAIGPWSFETRHKNGPMFNDLQHQENRINIASFLLGYRYGWEVEHSFVQPYAKLLAGLTRLNLMQDYTTTVVEDLKATIGLETGLYVFADSPCILANRNYRFRLSTTLLYLVNDKRYEAFPYFQEHTGPWMLQVGGSLEIEHDLAFSQN